VVVEQPLRLRSQFTRKSVGSLRFASGDEALRQELYEKFGEVLFEDFRKVSTQVEAALSGTEDDQLDDADDEIRSSKPAVPEKKRKKLLKAETWARDGRLAEAGRALHRHFGERLFDDFNDFRTVLDEGLSKLSISLSQPERKVLARAVSWRDESAPPVISKIHKPGKVQANPLEGLFEATIEGKRCIVEYEPDTDLRDSEEVPLQEPGGIEAFIRREILPYAKDAWIDGRKTQIGYEISFTRYFYKPQPLRPVQEIKKDILTVERETEGLLNEIIGSSV
jgi:type I restriction enzyme M protein